MQTDCPEQTEREVRRWLRQEEIRRDTWTPILGTPPAAPTWELEFQGQQDAIAAGVYGPDPVIVTEARAGRGSIEVAADRVTIQVPRQSMTIAPR